MTNLYKDFTEKKIYTNDNKLINRMLGILGRLFGSLYCCTGSTHVTRLVDIEMDDAVNDTLLS
jgi:hypothetical protein